MAKQFIRHLEFYGFPDQNGYVSNIGNMDVDLSDLHKKDKQHDREIKCLSNEKADKKDLLELSATVESFIDTQSQINSAVVEELSGITSDIEKLKEIDNQYGEQLSALTDGVNDALCGVQNLGERVDDVEDNLAELSGKVETFSAETKDEFEDVWEELNKKLDKTEAEETYAKKEDVPTKDELDEILEDYATKEWVNEQGFLTQETGDARYARKEAVDALSDRVNSAVTDLNTKIYTVSGDLATFSSSTNARMGVLETNFETLRGEVNRKINEISGTVEGFDARITQNANDIDALEDELARKANKADLEALSGTVNSLSDLVNTKVSQTEFDNYKALVTNQFNNMDEKKLDKSAFTEALDAIDALSGAIDTEREERISGDTYILNEITNINNEITEIKEQAVDYGDRIQELEDGLAQEIADREQADLDLIGNSGDPYTADTIWGAKNFAKRMKDQAISDANQYTDDEIAALRGEFEQDFEDIERELTAKADVTYVDDSRNELKNELENEFNEEIQQIRDDAEYSHNYLKRMIRENTRAIADNKTEIDHNSNSIHAITAWDAAAYDYDPQYYDDSGNGILDVLHREFHRYASSAGSIRDVRIEDGMLIITYITPTGDQEVSTPITDIFDANAYYDKNQVDTMLAEKADVTALTQAIDDLVDEAPSAYNTLGKIADYLTANTENIVDIKEKISANTADIATNAENIAQNTQDIAQNAQDIDTLESGLTQANNDIDALESGLTQANNDIDALESGLAQANNDIDALESGLTEANNDIDTLESGLTEANNAIDNLESGLSEVNEAIDNLESGSTQIEAELATKANKAEVEAALATKANQAEVSAALARKVDSTTFDNAYNTLDQTKADLADMTAQLNEKVMKTTYEAKVADLQRQIDELRALIGG